MLADCDVGEAPPYGSPPTPCDVSHCDPALRITLTRSGPWPAGGYRVEATTESYTDRCDFAFPPQPGVVLLCPNGNPWWSVFATPRGDVGVTFRATPAPARLTLSLWRNGERLVERTFTPTYTYTRPPGAGCDPVCPGAPPEEVLVTP